MSSRTNTALVSVFYFILVVSCQHLSGQAIETTGTVRGTVSDTSGAIIPGSTVVLDGESTGQHLVRVTNDSGIFVFPFSECWCL